MITHSIYDLIFFNDMVDSIQGLFPRELTTLLKHMFLQLIVLHFWSIQLVSNMHFNYELLYLMSKIMDYESY